MLQEHTDGDAASSGNTAASLEAATSLQQAPQAEVSGQACLDMQLKSGAFCQVSARWEGQRTPLAAMNRSVRQ